MKMAKKVLSVILAVLMALSCFAVVTSAYVGAPKATAKKHASVWFTAGLDEADDKGKTATYITSNSKFSFPDPDDTSLTELTAKGGDVVYVYFYAESDYYFQTLASAILFPAGWLTPSEKLHTISGQESKSFSATNKKKIYYNADSEAMSVYPITMLTLFNEWEAIQPDGRVNLKYWPTEANGDISDGFHVADNPKTLDVNENDPTTPDLNKWKFVIFNQMASADAEYAVKLGDGEWIVRIPLFIPEDVADGTYQIIIPEKAAARADKTNGFNVVTEMVDADLEEGYEEDEIYEERIAQKWTYSDTQYLSYEGACITVTIGGDDEVDYSALETLYDTVKDTDLTGKTKASAAAFNTALAAAADMLADKTGDTQEQVNTAKTDLDDAFKALAAAADTAALAEQVAAAGNASQNDYAAATWTAIQGYVADAAAYLGEDADPAATEQGAIDTLKNNLAAALANKVGAANYTQLNAAIALAGTKTESWYTTETWSAMQTALTAANAVDKNLNANGQDTIDEATLNLNNAIAGLLEADADYTALTAAKNLAATKVEGDYTAASWSAMQAKLTAANNVATGLKAKDQATINTAADELNAAIDALVALGGANYTALDEAIAFVPAYAENYYTAETWEAYQTALAAANAVARDLKETQQATVDAAKNTLVEAETNLALKGADYTAVNTAKTNVPGDLTIYTNASVAELNAAISAVEEGKKIDEQTIVDGYAKAINDAIAALKLKADTAALEAAVANAAAANEGDYAPETWTAIQGYVADAANYIDKDLAEEDAQDAIDTLEANLTAALANKADAANYTALDAAIALAGTKTESWYTAASWSAMQTKLAAANAVDRNLNANGQGTIDTAANELNAAIEALVEADADYSALAAAITAAGKVKEKSGTASNYTAATWADFTAAKTAAQDVPTGLKVKDQATIDRAATHLTNAQGALEYADFDYTATNALVAEFRALNEKDYTAASWAAKKALVDNLVMDYKMDQYSKGMSQYTTLKNAKLVEAGPADYTAVQNAIAAAELLNEEDYTPESWDVLAAAIQAVDNTLNENYQDDVDAFAAAINKAIRELVEAGEDINYAELEALVASAESTNVVDATTATKAVFTQALQNAQAMLQAKTAETQEEVNALYDALLLAEQGLKYKANYAALDAAMSDASAYRADAYTEDSWNALVAACSTAGDIDRELENTDNNQTYIDGLTTAIRNAIAGLKLKPVESKGFVTDVQYTPVKGNSNTFTITVEGRPSMIQFVDYSHGGATRSYDRNHANVVSIVSYNAAGEEVNSLSKDIAYEVWTVTSKAAGPEMGIRAKSNGSSKWEDLDLAYNFNYEVVPTKCAVLSAELAATEGAIGKVGLTIVVEPDAQYCQIIMNDGSTVTLSKSKATVNGDGNLVFNTSAFVGEGANTITFRTLANDAWHASDVTVSYTGVAAK